VRRAVFSSTGDLTRGDGVEDRGRGSSVVSISAILSSAAASFFGTLFPSDCRFCGAPLVKLSRVPVCDACLEQIRRIDGTTCSVCGNRLLATYSPDESPCCGDCLTVEPPFEKALAYGAYEGALRDLIHLLKYEKVRPAAGVLGRMAGEALLELAPGFGRGTPLVVPVPLHAGKLRSRGFNQSELIARAALKIAPVGELAPAVLQRRRPTESQTGLSPHQRRLNVRGAFRAVRPAEISGKDIVLVDDVFTTGTTACECARVLRRAGASRVWVVTVARVLLREAIGVPAEGFEEEETMSGVPMAKAARA
jgi:ComF family protein